MRESDYNASTSLDHRKRFGQFFTPEPVARLMAQWVVANNPKTILDPAFGMGIFYDQVSTLYAEEKFYFTAYESDGHILQFYREGNRLDRVNIINKDYLLSDNSLFDGIICNPPYLRFQNFLNRHEILPAIAKSLNIELNGYTNIASIFLIKALNELNYDGNLAFVMPFEFFNTGYGEGIKKYLLDKKFLKQILIFSNEKEIFSEVTTTICVLLCKNDNRDCGIRISKIDSWDILREVNNISEIDYIEFNTSELNYKQKWTPLINSLFNKFDQPNLTCKLSFYGKVMRGIATGANDFFSFSKSKVEKSGIARLNFTKCITKSAQLRNILFEEKDYSFLHDNDKAVLCLDVKQKDASNIKKYIQYGESLKYNERYLTKLRKPWYKLESRAPSPILVGVFNRGNVKIVRNYTNALNFTCYHSFYPNMFGQKYLDKIFLYLLSDFGQAVIKLNIRTYGAGLEKLEPNDLNGLPCPSQRQFDVISDNDVDFILNIARNDPQKAINLSNELFLHPCFRENQSALSS